jgi:hypothetical protein
MAGMMGRPSDERLETRRFQKRGSSTIAARTEMRRIETGRNEMRKLSIACGLAFAMVVLVSCRSADPVTITVYKSPTCGCCVKWIDHLEAGGLAVEAIDTQDMARIKTENGVSDELASCHTALVDGYVIEGHVPVEDVLRLLEERPDVAGLAVPKMPIGSPGMEGPNPEPYDVLAFTTEGSTHTYASHGP